MVYVIVQTVHFNLIQGGFVFVVLKMFDCVL